MDEIWSHPHPEERDGRSVAVVTRLSPPPIGEPNAPDDKVIATFGTLAEAQVWCEGYVAGYTVREERARVAARGGTPIEARPRASREDIERCLVDYTHGPLVDRLLALGVVEMELTVPVRWPAGVTLDRLHDGWSLTLEILTASGERIGARGATGAELLAALDRPRSTASLVTTEPKPTE